MPSHEYFLHDEFDSQQERQRTGSIHAPATTHVSFGCRRNQPATIACAPLAHKAATEDPRHHVDFKLTKTESSFPLRLADNIKLGGAQDLVDILSSMDDADLAHSFLCEVSEKESTELSQIRLGAL